MKGGQVAYNLRPNKFVERQLFVDLLSILCLPPRDQYVYVSLSGPMLEDQRLVHQRLGWKKLVSLEGDEVIYKRQLFNCRPSYIKCCNSSTADFVNDFDRFADLYSNERFLFWFDYSDANARQEQLAEYETLLRRLKDGDLIKITMNANPGTLGEKQKGESEDELQRRRAKTLRDDIGDYLPAFFEHTAMTTRDIIPILCHAIKQASLNAVKADPRSQPIPLATFVYQDGPHQMLTVTVNRTRKADVDCLRETLKSNKWEYLPSEWTKAKRICVPNLSPAERMHIEKLLFSDDVKTIHENLPFCFDKDPATSLAILEEYAAHYRRYPSYFQVVI